MIQMTRPLLPLLAPALFALCLAAAAPLAAADPARPNILLVLADNWGWPHAGALGDPVARTDAP